MEILKDCKICFDVKANLPDIGNRNCGNLNHFTIAELIRVVSALGDSAHHRVVLLFWSVKGICISIFIF